MTSDSHELPLVSVVTPCRNARQWLTNCRESVRLQSYPHVEHVVIDGGSQDGTRELLESWTDVSWVSESDNGQSEAINKGIRLSRGHIVTWLNADDELMPGAVERVVEVMTRETRPEWVVGAAEMREGGAVRIARPGRLTKRTLDISNPIVQPAAFFTRQLWDRVGGIDERLHLAMDLDLWLRFLRAGTRPMVVRDVLAVVNIHADAKTRAVDLSRWYFEMGMARARNMRMRAAAVEFGRSAVERRTDGELEVPLRDLRREFLALGLSVPRVPFRAGALVRLAVRSPSAARRLRYLARPEPWMVRQTRTELWSGLRTRLRRT